MDADLALADAVRRADLEARELALLEDPLMSELMEYALLCEVEQDPSGIGEQ